MTYISKWGGSVNEFILTLCDSSISEPFEFSVISSQAADMAAFILDYIRAIMAEADEASSAW